MNDLHVYIEPKIRLFNLIILRKLFGGTYYPLTVFASIFIRYTSADLAKYLPASETPIHINRATVDQGNTSIG